MAETMNPLTQPQEDAKLINKLYDDDLASGKQTLADNYTQNGTALDDQQKSTQQQTGEYLTRTEVEAQKAQMESPNAPMLSGGARDQQALTLGNQKQKDVSTLRDAQAQADAAFDRERQLLASQYEADIKQAQADNDMGRAQQLYDAAKQEEDRLRALRKSAGDLMAGKGDYSIVESLYELPDDQTAALGSLYGTTEVPADYAVPDSLKADQEALSKIYEAQAAGENAQLEAKYNRDQANLDAEQAAQRRQTDKDLTQAYVDSLKSGKNYNEVQTAYGMGSGTKAQAALAREAGLQEDLTALRTLQLGKDAQAGLDSAALKQDYLSGKATNDAEADRKITESLIGAYQDQVNQKFTDQEAAGKILAEKKNDYSVLGKLYGLTQDQQDRLQGTGAYSQPEKDPNWINPDEIVAAKYVENAVKGGSTPSQIQAGLSGSDLTPTQKTLAGIYAGYLSK